MIELMAVIFIVSIIALAMIPALDSMVPSYRLRSGARNVASMIELAQSETIANRKEYAIAYDLDENTYWIVLPPAPPEEEQQTPEEPGADATKRPPNDVEHGLPPVDPEAEQQVGTVADVPGFEERDYLEPERLPDGVEFDRVVLGDDEKTTGRVYIPFSHLGSAGAHLVGVKLTDPESREVIWVKFSPLSRTLDLSAERPEQKTLQSATGGPEPAPPPPPGGG